MVDDPVRRRFAAIVNPVSGRRPMLPVVNRIREVIEDQGGSFEILVTEHAGHAVEHARAVDDSFDAVLIVGGDGTVAEVLGGLDVARVPFLILPTGTENLLACELRMPWTPDEVAETLRRGEEVSFDLGTVNGRRFAALLGVGFDAECVRRLVQKRKGHITHIDYFGPIWKTFWLHRFPRLTVLVDESKVFEGKGLVIAGNIPRYARNMRILRDARWDDGLLDVVVFPCASRWRLLVHAVRVLMQRHIGRGGVTHWRCKRLTVHADGADVDVEVDGDLAGHLPVTVELVAGAARFLRLPDRSGQRAAGRTASHSDGRTLRAV